LTQNWHKRSAFVREKKSAVGAVIRAEVDSTGGSPRGLTAILIGGVWSQRHDDVAGVIACERHHMPTIVTSVAVIEPVMIS
jgi:hypothetical protein